MSCVTQVKAALARFLFCCHALVTVWRVVSQVGSKEPGGCRESTKVLLYREGTNYRLTIQVVS